jgi:hypothetical protein
LAQIALRPKLRISMRSVKFPHSFSKSSGSISETNVICEVYKDNCGLEYWLHAEDSATHKMGDLIEIIYGPGGILESQFFGKK